MLGREKARTKLRQAENFGLIGRGHRGEARLGGVALKLRPTKAVH